MARLPRTFQTSEFVQSKATQNVINLGLGQPSPALLPLTLIKNSLTDRLKGESDPLCLQYGNSQGYATFRQKLSSFLSSAYGKPVEANELMVTAGNTQALAMLSARWRSKGDWVCVENPTYFLASGIFRELGYNVMPIPVDEEGMRVDVLREHVDNGLKPAFIYTIPNFHNPTGATMSTKRRRELVSLARQTETTIISDEPYTLLARPSDGKRHGPLLFTEKELCKEDGANSNVVVSAGSFSKILSPGLRLGWLHASPDMIKDCLQSGVLLSGGGLNPPACLAVERLLESSSGPSPLAKHIEETVQVFESRIQSLTAALEQHLRPLGCEWKTPEGGYFLWVELPRDVSATAVVEEGQKMAEKEGGGVMVTAGGRCQADAGSAFDDRIRLTWAFYDEEELAEGVRRLGVAVKAVTSRP